MMQTAHDLDAEFCQQATDHMHQLGTLSHQQFSRSMKR